jgi:hypothetical protein
MTAQETVKKITAAFSSTRIIVVLVVVGWGPIFIADAVRSASPNLDASYRTQSFAMQWMLVTVPCSVLASILMLVHALRLAIGVLRRRTRQPPGKMSKTKVVSGVLILIGIVMSSGCNRGSKREVWLIPEGYVGWLRLDYSVPGAPALPGEGGRLIVRLPRSGHLQTSSANKPTIDRNEYVSDGRSGRKRLALSTNIIPEYSVQNAYSFGKGRLNSGWPSPEAECVFVGTRADFVSNGRNCMVWQLNQPEPPKWPKRMAEP